MRKQLTAVFGGAAVWLLGVGMVLAEPANEARQILNDSGVKGGLIVHVGCGDGQLTAALRGNESYLVHGLDADPANVEKARAHIRSLGIYGPVSVMNWPDRAHLPYADNLVNLLVISGPASVTQDEATRVLAPGGVAMFRNPGPEIQYRKSVKPWPKEIDEWTHWLHGADGNAVAQDTTVGPPRRIQWTAGPTWDRSHDLVPSTSVMVSSRGRVFYICDEGPAAVGGGQFDHWFLVARDAFNGVLLWKRPMSKWGWSQWRTTWDSARFGEPIQVHKKLVAAGDVLYGSLDFRGPLTAFDAASGQTIRTYAGTEGWSELIVDGDRLILALGAPAQEASQGRGAPPPMLRACAVDARSGKKLWETGPFAGISSSDTSDPVGRLEVVAGGGQVCFLDTQQIVCLDAQNGKKLWAAPRPPRPQGRPGGGTYGIKTEGLSALVLCRGVLLLAEPDRAWPLRYYMMPGTLHAFSTKTGQSLWSHPYGAWGFLDHYDIYVIDDLVWINEFNPKAIESANKKTNLPDPAKADYAVLGLDLSTGQVKRRHSTREIFDVGHHHRCYRNVATSRFLLTARRGTEFIDLESGENDLNHWARGACLLGVVPCNGLLYLTPHPCDCYIKIKLNGFYALAPQNTHPNQRPETGDEHRLQRGPAYDEASRHAPAIPGSANDWPTYRHDAQRSGATSAAVSAQLVRRWEANAGGRPSSPVIAGGKLFVAAVDEYRLAALDAGTGAVLWTYTTGGRVDTPPTAYRNVVLFGCADGWVYCLRAADGVLVWRWRAAPGERLVGSRGRLESAWPTHGTVLVNKDIAYVGAGRSSFLDGGIHIAALEPLTGKMLTQQTISTLDPKTGKMPKGDFNNLPDGLLDDILVSDGSAVYMRQMKVAGSGGRGVPVSSTGGMLDASLFNRTTWKSGPCAHAQLLIFNDQVVCGFSGLSSNTRDKNLFSPGKQGCRLFAYGSNARPSSRSQTEAKPSPKSRTDEDSGAGGGGRPRSLAGTLWSMPIPVRVSAMVLAGSTLFAAGSPDVVPDSDPLAAIEGRQGGRLWAVNVADGSRLGAYELPAPPVWDGMAVAGGRLYISLANGSVVCYGTP